MDTLFYHSLLQKKCYLHLEIELLFCLAQMGTLSCIVFELEFQHACVEKRKRYLGVENGANKNHDTEKENMTVLRYIVSYIL